MYAYAQAGRWDAVLLHVSEVVPRLRALSGGEPSELEARVLRSQATAFAKQAQHAFEQGDEATALREAAAGEEILAGVLAWPIETGFEGRLRYELRDLRDRALRLETQVLFGAGAFPAAQRALELRVQGLDAILALDGLPDPFRRAARSRRVEALALSAEVARVRGDLAEARRLAFEAISREEEEGLPARIGIVLHRVRGLVAEEMSDLEQAALEYQAEGEAIGKRAAELSPDDRDGAAALASDRANLQRCLGDVARKRGQLERALDAYERGAAELDELAEGPRLRHRVQLDYRRGLVLHSLGRSEGARRALQRALDDIEVVHRDAPEVGAAGIYSLGETRALLEAWLELTVGDGNDAAGLGLRAVEAVRARGLLRQLTSPRTESLDPALLERVSASRAATWKRQDPALAKVERRDLLEILFRMQVAQERERASAPSFDEGWLEKVQRHLAERGDVAIAYFSGPKYLWIWRLDGVRIQVVRRALSSDELAALVRTTFRTAGTRVTDPAMDDVAFRDALIEKMRATLLPELANANGLWIVPDATLNLVPWPFVLPVEHAVHRVIPAFQVALAWSDRASHAFDGRSQILLVGGVRGRGHEGLEELLGPAPLARREIDHLASQFGGRVFVLRGSYAQEGDVRAAIEREAFAVLHVNVHGIHDPFVPSSSGLVLEPDAGDDGFLWADEVSRLTSVPPIVVLNACSTGRGELDPSEGIMGLVRAFLERGALAVVANLWDVDDASAYRFAQDFYERLKRGDDLETAMAYGVARIRREKPHPYHWSGYVLLGEGSLHLPENLQKPVVPEGLGPYVWAVWAVFVVFVAAVATLVVTVRRRALRAMQ